jgi:TolB-like protein/Flp pilus assembly protein TadD
MHLVFYKSPEEPAQSAFEISRALKDNQRLQVRMGIHSGPVSGVVDVNERTNVAGAGINLAQRVMDCGDAGHTLLSHHVAEDLAEYEEWRPFLHDIGTFEVKHGARVSVTNLYSDEVGNPNLPSKLQAVKKHHAHVRWAAVATGLLVLGVIVAAFMIVSRRPITSLTAIPEKSIAVLPFVNMSEDKANDYFSDGISEELLNLLAKIPQLQVTARTSSFAFKGKEIGIPEIAHTLHVGHVLEGSVRKAGNSVRITAQLIKAGTDTHLWSQTYDRKLDDIFAVQDEIAADVVKQLKVTLLGAAPKARTTDPEAYALYLQAVQLGRPFTAEAFQQSDALYRKVLAIDPRYAPAWCGLARNFGSETSQGLLPGKEGFAQAREAAVKALAIDPDYAPAHAQLGWIAMYGDNDLAGAALHLERALALEPADLRVLTTSATLLQSLGRLDEALALEEAAVRRDPVNVTALFNLGYHQRMVGRLDAAIASFRTVLSLSPSNGGAHCQLGVALLLKGDAKGALAEIEQETSEIYKMIGLPMAYLALGRKADSDAALAALIAKYEKDAPSNIASVYSYRGEADKAFAWLDKAVDYGDGGLGEIVTDNLFDKIHANPRWLPFLRKVGKAPEQLAKIEFKVTLPQ